MSIALTCLYLLLVHHFSKLLLPLLLVIIIVVLILPPLLWLVLFQVRLPVRKDNHIINIHLVSLTPLLRQTSSDVASEAPLLGELHESLPHAGNAEGAVKVVHVETERVADAAHAEGGMRSAEGARRGGGGDGIRIRHARAAWMQVQRQSALLGADIAPERAAETEPTPGCIADANTSTSCLLNAGARDGELGGMEMGAGGPEEQWLEAEIERIEQRRAKEKKRKTAQLQRRAEHWQPLPFPGFGYSPPPRTETSPQRPRPFLTTKATTPTALGTQTATSAQAATGARSVVTAEDELLEDEHERIYMIQAHAPWAETRFAKYLTVDTLPHTDDRSTSRGDRKTAAVQDVGVHQPHDAQLAKVQRRAAEAHWAETLRAARSANAGIKPKVHAPGLLQHKCDAGRIQQMQQNGRDIGRQRRCGGSCSWRPRTGAARRRGRRGRLWSPKYGYGD
ncbi:hypothetical protein B0H14DRAFT_2581963 [Mycena olivaceomarginata]|nr:hypothetical protein B0H14DRAFT_2581963 [Mycena olivaceomarginata]